MHQDNRQAPNRLFDDRRSSGPATRPLSSAASSWKRGIGPVDPLPQWARPNDEDRVEDDWIEDDRAVDDRAEDEQWGRLSYLPSSADAGFDDYDDTHLHERILLGVGSSPWRIVVAAAVVVFLGAVVQLRFGSTGPDGATAAVGLGRERPSPSQAAADDAIQPGADTVRSGPAVSPATLEDETDGADPIGDDDPIVGAGQTDDADDTGSIEATGESVESEPSSDAGGAAPPALPTTSDASTAPGPTDGTVAAGAAAAGSAAADIGATAKPTPGPGASRPDVAADYGSNLELIRAQTIRNRNEDDSPYRDVASADLVPENHYGPRSDYLVKVDGNVEPAFPVANGGQFRVACEFSHFAYDDPLVYPGRPGASHLHMFFGNTDTNAYSTADSIKNSGGSTCNGNELNRTGYWVPAMFDGQGNVRIPERVVIYYKGEGLARGNAEVFPPGAAMIASVDLNTINPADGGAAGKFSYNCANNYSGLDSKLSNTMPSCDGDTYFNLYGVDDPYEVLEVNVKFPQCWNGQDPGNPANFRHPRYAGWYGSVCEGEFNRTLVNLEYFVNYRVERGETTSGWYLSSDVSPTERVLAQTPGSTNHGDWWSGWHDETNRMFIDNCVNYANPSGVPSGCGFGYLTDGGPDNQNPLPGPALKLRDQYLGPLKVPAVDLHAELCPNGPPAATAAAAAFCTPATATAGAAPTGSGPASNPVHGPVPGPAHGPASLFCPVHRGMLAANPASPVNRD